MDYIHTSKMNRQISSLRREITVSSETLHRLISKVDLRENSVQELQQPIVSIASQVQPDLGMHLAHKRDPLYQDETQEQYQWHRKLSNRRESTESCPLHTAGDASQPTQIRSRRGIRMPRDREPSSAVEYGVEKSGSTSDSSCD